VLAVYGTAPASFKELHLEGGPPEMIVEGGRAIVVISGEAGERAIKLPPGAWKIPQTDRIRIIREANEWEFKLGYDGNAPVMLVFAL
jgi:hypothetical protein